METTTVFVTLLLCKNIAQTLTTEDVRHCILVCRNWYATFGPYLFQTITFRKRSSIDTFMSPRVQELFSRYAANMRSIPSYSDNIWSILLAAPLKNLTVLEMKDFSVDSQIYDHSIDYMYYSFLKRWACHRLESFVGSIKQQDPELVMSALLEHRDTLEVVDLKRIGVIKATGPMMHSLLSACSKLKTFSAMASSAYSDRRRESSRGDPVLLHDLGNSLTNGTQQACTQLTLLELHLESGCEATGQKNPEYELELVPESLIKQSDTS